jgi:hypothetical protein
MLADIEIPALVERLTGFGANTQLVLGISEYDHNVLPPETPFHIILFTE